MSGGRKAENFEVALEMEADGDEVSDGASSSSIASTLRSVSSARSRGIRVAMLVCGFDARPGRKVAGGETGEAGSPA